MTFKPHFESVLLAKRWLAVVNFGSPMTAWSAEMLEAYRLANGDKTLATTILKGLKP